MGIEFSFPRRTKMGPEDFRWKHDGKLRNFFKYNSKLGRTLQLQLDGPLRNGWQILGILDKVLTFWKGLWCLNMIETSTSLSTHQNIKHVYKLIVVVTWINGKA